MPQPPAAIIASVPPTARAKVSTWWDSLAAATQLELAASWSSRSETCRYSRKQGKWQVLPVLVGARYLPKDADPTEDVRWHQDWFDYLMDHPELVLSQKTFHICTAHSEARNVLQQGLIPASFECKLRNAHCPMRAVLAGQPGCSVQLFPLASTPAPSLTERAESKPPAITS